MRAPGFWSDVVYTPTGFQFVVHQFGDPLPVAGLDESGREVWRFNTADGMWFMRAAALADGTIAMVGQGHTSNTTQCYIRHVDGRIQKVEISNAFAWGQNGSLVRAESNDGWLLAFQTGSRTWRKVHLLREGGISYEATQPLPTWPGGDGSSSQGFLYWDAAGEPVFTDPARVVTAHGQPIMLSMVAENGVRVGQVPHADGVLVIYPTGRMGVFEPHLMAFEPHIISHGDRFAVTSRSLNGFTIIGVLSQNTTLEPVPPVTPPPSLPPIEPPPLPPPPQEPSVKLSTAAKEVIVRFAAKFPLETTEDGSRAWTHKLTQQLAFSLPADGWGHKAASDTRPHSADCIAIAQPFIGWDVISGGGAPGATLALENDSIDLSGQTFEAVEAINYLADSTTPPPVTAPPADSVSLTSLLEELQKHTVILTTMAAGLAALPGQLEASIGALKASFDKGVKIRF